MSDKGQSLMELMIVIAVGLIVFAALTFATITSLRNAHFSRNQLQATKYAQEGVEKVRSIRDRDGSVVANFGTPITKFSQLWGVKLYEACNPQPCQVNFLLDPINNILTYDNNTEDLGDSFQRRIIMTDNPTDYSTKKTIIILVSWVDFAGSHQSKLATYLRKI